MRLDASSWARRQLTVTQTRLIRAAEPREATLGLTVGRYGWNAGVTHDRQAVGLAHNRDTAWGAVRLALAEAGGTCHRCGHSTVRVGPYFICRSLSCPVLVVGTVLTKGATA